MKPYINLRKEFLGLDIDQKTAAAAIGRSPRYVGERLRGGADWELHEVYTLLKLIGKGPEDILTYFPPNGGATKRK